LANANSFLKNGKICDNVAIFFGKMIHCSKIRMARIKWQTPVMAEDI